MNRREFLKGLGAALASLALPKAKRPTLKTLEDGPARVGRWHHFSATFEGSAREVHLDGDGPEAITMSAWIDVPPEQVVVIQIWNGSWLDAQDIATWDVALTDDEVALLAQGVSPMLVRPDALQTWAPCYRGEVT